MPRPSASTRSLPVDPDAKSGFTAQGLPWLVVEIAFIGALLLLAYSNHFHNSFHFDDSHTIVNNAAIRSVGNIPRFFSDATTFSALPSNQSYRPLVSTSLALDYAMGRGDPFWFQLSGFIYFLIEVILLALVIGKLLDAHLPHPLNARIAVACAGLYALHPANADTVNYIIARSDILSTLAVLASLAWAQRGTGRVSTAFFAFPAAAGVLAKPPSAMFAPLYAVYACLFPACGGSRPHPVRRRLTRIALAFILCGAATAFVSRMTPRQWVAGSSNPTGYLLTQPYVALLYFKTFFWPTGLSADYDLSPFSSLADVRPWAGFLFTGLLAGAALYCACRRNLRVIGFGLIWFIVALLPTSLMPLAEVMNDHRTFFPYAGLVMALAGSLQIAMAGERKWSAAGRAIFCCAALACFAAASIATYRRNADWKDEESLWHDVTIKSPRNGRGLMNYGNTQMAKGNYPVALDYFHRAQQFTPNYPVLFINLAIVEGAMGHPAVAESYFERGLALAPGIPDSYTFYARWLLQQGRVSEALPLLRKALALGPGDLTAQSLLSRAVRITVPSPTAAESWLEVSLQRYRAKDYPASIAAAETALKLRPDYAEAWNNLGAARNSLGEYAPAIAALTRALQLKPDWPLARNNLAYARQMLARR